MENSRKVLVLGGGGFIGGHLAKRLFNEGFWVRIVDIKKHHEFFNHDDICNEYLSLDLRNPVMVEEAFALENDKSYEEVYQLEVLPKFFHHLIFTNT